MESGLESPTLPSNKTILTLYIPELRPLCALVALKRDTSLSTAFSLFMIVGFMRLSR